MIERIANYPSFFAGQDQWINADVLSKLYIHHPMSTENQAKASSCKGEKIAMNHTRSTPLRSLRFCVQ
jgi:hypothetical protein